MPQKLIVIMIDGVSADYFASERGRLPHLSGLAARGLTVENLHSEVLGISLGGRTGMLTGVTADVSGVYGNLIYDPAMGQFRYANPDDIRVPTIAARAKEAGRDVAAIGFGMIRPEDTHSFKPPWWVTSFVQRARDAEPVPSDAAWMRVFGNQDSGERFNRACDRAGYPNGWPVMEVTNRAEGLLYGLMCDQHALNWVGILATDEEAPDFIIAEYLITDTVQHYTGYKSTMSHWSIADADSMVGVMLERLRAAGVEDQWNIAVMSDHGHSVIEQAIHPQVIIPGTVMQSEGSVLNVVPRDAAHLAEITEKLAAYGVEPFHVEYVPEDVRPLLASFVAPPRTSFEHDNPDETEPVGKPGMTSSHGLRPGDPGDDRFAVFAGPDVPQGVVKEADAVQVAPTFAALLGLPLDGFPASPIFALKEDAVTSA
ncbi:MAG: alkaline phosphatase family protein [bacterium]|nr:alkaline phosphatase family protein [bacterium]